MKPRIDLRIDELVLHGITGDRARIARAVERELSRRLASSGVPAGARGAARVDGGRFQARPGAPPDAVGADVARAVWTGLGGKR